MPYWRLHYHLIWTTKGREPFIDDPVGAAIERSVRGTCDEPGVQLFAIGMMPDHVHLVVSIPPRLPIADLIGRTKGASSCAANGPDLGVRASRSAWQGEYSVLSFGEKAMPLVLEYGQNQPAPHAANNLWAQLERTTDP